MMLRASKKHGMFDKGKVDKKMSCGKKSDQGPRGESEHKKSMKVAEGRIIIAIATPYSYERMYFFFFIIFIRLLTRSFASMLATTPGQYSFEPQTCEVHKIFLVRMCTSTRFILCFLPKPLGRGVGEVGLAWLGIALFARTQFTDAVLQ